MPNNTPNTNRQIPGQHQKRTSPENDDALDRQNDRLRGNQDSRNRPGGDEEE